MNRYRVTLRADMGDHYEDTSLGIYYGDSIYEVEASLPIVSGDKWYVIIKA